jgi:pyrroline-5-carboxylate reductase
MAEALVAGLIKAKLLEPARMLVSDVRNERLEHLSAKYKVKTTRNNLEVARDCDTVLLAVKPTVAGEVLDEISTVLGSHQLVISIVAGLPIASIEGRLAKPVAVIRVMPNTPALVQETAAGLAAGSRSTAAHLDMAVRMFNSIGEAHVVVEEQMDAVTALSGSGPAYFFRMVEAMVAAGVAEGLDQDTAHALAVQTAYGAARMMSQTMEDPASLRKKVTSPGGTTEAALKVLEDGKWGEILQDAIRAAKARSAELARGA